MVSAHRFCSSANFIELTMHCTSFGSNHKLQSHLKRSLAAMVCYSLLIFQAFKAHMGFYLLIQRELLVLMIVTEMSMI